MYLPVKMLNAFVMTWKTRIQTGNVLWLLRFALRQEVLKRKCTFADQLQEKVLLHFPPSSIIMATGRWVRVRVKHWCFSGKHCHAYLLNDWKLLWKTNFIKENLEDWKEKRRICYIFFCLILSHYIKDKWITSPFLLFTKNAEEYLYFPFCLTKIFRHYLYFIFIKLPCLLWVSLGIFAGEVGMVSSFWVLGLWLWWALLVASHWGGWV